MSSGDIECLPLGRAQIRQFATKVRIGLGLEKVAYVRVEELLEFILPKAIPSFTFDIREANEMRDNHGLTNVDEKVIILREDVYDGALRGVGRDRMTVAHELGHLLLHGRDRIFHRRAVGPPKAYRDPEWQAKAFAGEFLVSELFVNDFPSVYEVAQGFGVSEDAARFQVRQLAKDGKIKRADLRSALSIL
jgi:Zn-dependent peptidase ImmA (M78 family)